MGTKKRTNGKWKIENRIQGKRTRPPLPGDGCRGGKVLASSTMFVRFPFPVARFRFVGSGNGERRFTISREGKGSWLDQ